MSLLQAALASLIAVRLLKLLPQVSYGRFTLIVNEKIKVFVKTAWAAISEIT